MSSDLDREVWAPSRDHGQWFSPWWLMFPIVLGAHRLGLGLGLGLVDGFAVFAVGLLVVWWLSRPSVHVAITAHRLQIGPFGFNTLDLHWEDVVHVRPGPHDRSLQIRDARGHDHTVLRGVDRGEIRWLAATLAERARAHRPLTPAETSEMARVQALGRT